VTRPFKKKIVMRRVVPSVASSVASSVDPAFMMTYIGSVCGQFEGPLLQNCMASLYVPPLEEQFRIMDVLRNVSEIVDVTPIMGSLMNLLVHGKDNEFKELVAAFVENQIQIEKIKSLVEDAMPIIVDIVEI